MENKSKVKFVSSYLICIKSIFVKARRYLDELTKNTIRWHKKLLMEIGGDLIFSNNSRDKGPWMTLDDDGIA